MELWYLDALGLGAEFCVLRWDLPVADRGSALLPLPRNLSFILSAGLEVLTRKIRTGAAEE